MGNSSARSVSGDWSNDQQPNTSEYPWNGAPLGGARWRVQGAGRGLVLRASRLPAPFGQPLMSNA
eukprot:3506921-Alexandrium_andersonii.AAC.1